MIFLVFTRALQCSWLLWVAHLLRVFTEVFTATVCNVVAKMLLGIFFLWFVQQCNVVARWLLRCCVFLECSNSDVVAWVLLWLLRGFECFSQQRNVFAICLLSVFRMLQLECYGWLLRGCYAVSMVF